MTTGRAVTCDVWDLARRRACIEGELALEDMRRLSGQLADTAGALRYRMSGMIDERGRPAARLEVRGPVQVRCDRCGGAVQMGIDEQARFYFVADEDELGRLPIDDAPDEPLLGSRRFDVGSLVEEQAILALPISPRHDECAGASAATDRGPDGGTQRPFAALASLKKLRR